MSLAASPALVSSPSAPLAKITVSSQGASSSPDPTRPLRFAIPKGRMWPELDALLSESGLRISLDGRAYRPTTAVDWLDAKVQKPQAIVEMLDAGIRDVGITGADWVAELGADVVEVLDLQLNPVRVVAAASDSFLVDGKLPQRPMRVASEYLELTRRWIAQRGYDAQLIRSWGATEVLPPEDADVIVDNTATGSTLSANRLTIVEEVMRSTTRLYASKRAWACAEKRQAIEEMALLLRSVLDARKRVVLELNVEPNALDRVLAMLPSMREPTVAKLADDRGYAVKAAVLRKEVPNIVPRLRAAGGTDILVSRPAQIIP